MTNAIAITRNGQTVEVFPSCRTTTDWYATTYRGDIVADHQPSLAALIATLTRAAAKTEGNASTTIRVEREEPKADAKDSD